MSRSAVRATDTIRWPVINVRFVRLASGLVLFTYIAFHLANHALGNVSLAAMETMLLGMKSVWQSLPGEILLYSALISHLALGIWALYERRQFQWRRSEVMQLVLGFCIPVLLANHILATRVSLSVYGTEKGYIAELFSFWVVNTPFGIVQHIVLLVAWAHGCLGVYFWLRLRPWFRRAAPLLLAAAVLLPALALLGSFQAGRQVQVLATDPAWRALHLPPGVTGTAAQNATLAHWRSISWVVFGAVVAGVLIARGLRGLYERRHGMVRLSTPEGRMFAAPLGLSVLEALRLHRVPHTSVCGGRGRCTTCRILVLQHAGLLPKPEPGEAAALAKIGAGRTVRLACQLRPDNDLTMMALLPADGGVGAPREEVHAGEERYLVMMFVDLRGSTRLAEGRLPFDTVFVINRFLTAVGRAVTDAGGVSNQMLGDGMLALFGLKVDRNTASRQSLAAVDGIARNVEALNVELAAGLPAPLRFGIGIQGGEVIVGDIGYEAHKVFTVLGDAVNVAARLESLTKDFHCEALVSDTVYRDGGGDPDALPVHEATARGREETLLVRALRVRTALA